MSIQLEITAPSGNKSFFKSANNLAARTRFGVEKGLWRSGKDIQSEFSRQVLAKNKTGTLYKIRGRKHQASGEGETPANITGNYRKAFDFSVSGSNLIVGNTAEYAGYLESGTSRMQARPGLFNAIKSSERNIIRNLSGEIEAAL